ncbi:MAG TPA: penicillin acylase family protein [Alphaproteobacteria bacterium]
MKWVLRAFGAVLALVVLAAAAAFAWLASSLPQTAGQIPVASPTAEVEIIRDAHGVPHIFASSEADAIYALGFVHAQDRLFQMDMMRMAGQGRLSEMFGPSTLDLDRLMRTLDIAGQADATFAALAPKWRDLLSIYAAGVNAFLETRSGTLPPEFMIAGRTPEPWQPRDSILWGKLMALQLSGNWRDELTRARLANRLSPEMLRELWPEWPSDDATTLAARGDLYRDLDLDGLADALPAPLGPRLASNEWVLSGALTRSGKPILVNDPHLSLNAPGQWYLVRIETPDFRLVGASAPGVPAVVLGHNGHVAWGFTTTTADTHDLFIERVDPADPTRYLTPDGSRPFGLRSETIKVKGEADVVMTVRTTRHGVVISDLNRSAREVAGSGHVVSLAMPGFRVADRTPAALFGLNRARNWTEFSAALSDWYAPMQNIVYADRDGNIGFYSPGLVPVRKSGTGWMPQPGWTGAYDWIGFAPFDQLPHAFNPPSGRIINANNRIVPEDFPVFISRDWDAPYRARRIAELLDARPVHDAAGMADILTDAVSLFARELLPGLLRTAPRDDLSRAALARLGAWNGDMRRDRPEPLIFSAWMRELTKALIADELGPLADEIFRAQPVLLHRAVDGTSSFCDDTRTPAREDCTTQVAQALHRAVAWLAERHGQDIDAWRWGDVHVAPFRHALLSRLPVVRDIVGFHVPTDGDYFTVNRGATRINDPVTPFAHVHGAGYRAIYDLSDLDQSLFIAVPGQSGHPLSPHRGDLAPIWADGGHIRLSGTRESLRATGDVLILAPP